MKHTRDCPKAGRWFKLPECREFSTDGTRLGAEIAHEFGTTDEKEIERIGWAQEQKVALTGMPEEQADWEEESDWGDPQHGFDAYGVNGYEL